MLGPDLDPNLGLALDLNFNPNWLSSMVLGGKNCLYKLVLDVILLTGNFHLSSFG